MIALNIAIQACIGPDRELRIATLRWLYDYPDSFVSTSQMPMLAVHDLLDIKSGYGWIPAAMVEIVSDPFLHLIQFAAHCASTGVPVVSDDDLTLAKWLQLSEAVGYAAGS